MVFEAGLHAGPQAEQEEYGSFALGFYLIHCLLIHGIGVWLRALVWWC